MLLACIHHQGAIARRHLGRDAMIKTQGGAVRRATAPARRAIAPAPRAIAPAPRATAPARRATAPARRATAPARRATAPARRATTPAQRATAPRLQATRVVRHTGRDCFATDLGFRSRALCISLQEPVFVPARAPVLSSLEHPRGHQRSILHGGRVTD